MKKLLPILFTILSLSTWMFLGTTYNAQAIDTCNPTPSPGYPVLQNTAETLKFPGAWKKYGLNNSTTISKISTTYRATIAFDDQSIGSLKLSQSGDDAVVGISSGFPLIKGYTYKLTEVTLNGTVVSNNDQKCQGTLFIAGDCTIASDTSSCVDGCGANSCPSCVTNDRCGQGYNCAAHLNSQGEGSYAWVGSCEFQAGSGSGTAGPQGNGFGALNNCTGINKPGINTVFGCIQSDPASFVNNILKLVWGIAGFLAVLFIVIGGYKVAASAGDPDALEDGRSMITHAIIGLAFILLATVILSIIGIDILGISFFHQVGGGLQITQ